MPNQQWCGKNPADRDKKATAERSKVTYIYSLLIAFVCQLNAHLDTWLNANVTIAELGLLLNIASQPRASAEEPPGAPGSEAFSLP